MKTQYENRYCCTPCMSTTKHSVSGSTYVCLRCGVVKQAVRTPQPQAASFAASRGVFRS